MKVAIIAGGHGKQLAPLGDPAWECWGLNAMWSNFNHPFILGGRKQPSKFTRWFELHRRSYLTWEHQADGHHFSFLRMQDVMPVYVQTLEDWPDIATAKAFPFEAVQGLAPAFGYYHACSIDWMIAYAITEGATEIRLFGVEQDHSSEPMGSRACVEFWCGFAVARGITVSSADGSTFKLAHLCYTKTSYALDPLWLPYEDRDETSEKAEARRALKKTVDEYIPPLRWPKLTGADR